MNFSTIDFSTSFLGGLLIGLAVTLMLLFKGRVTGISGITYGFFRFEKEQWSWKGSFILGLLSGGLLLRLFLPESLESSLNYGWLRISLAGLLVGYGTLLGNGCTSGHGVCGISRFSNRSILATSTFIFSGILTVAVISYFSGGS